MSLFDTHCHIHEAVRRTTPVYDKWHEKGFDADPERMLADAKAVGVDYLLCVGTTLEDSQLAIEFAENRENTWVSIGIHPHEAAEALQNGHLDAFAGLVDGLNVKAVGETGLDYFYAHSPKEDQLKVLRFQIELALKHNLPMSFHVREAFDDFWPVFESYKGIRGVLHSFTDSPANLERALGHGLYIGVNGIATFTKSAEQRVMYVTIPSDRLLFETDAPFLTPAPFRGSMCEPKHVRVTAEFVSHLRAPTTGESLEQTIAATTTNAKRLFGV
jgi:TatD DNase family protein